MSEVPLGPCNLEYWKDNFLFCLSLGTKFKFYVICGRITEYASNFVNCYKNTLTSKQLDLLHKKMLTLPTWLSISQTIKQWMTASRCYRCKSKKQNKTKVDGTCILCRYMTVIKNKSYMYGQNHENILN